MHGLVYYSYKFECYKFSVLIRSLPKYSQIKVSGWFSNSTGSRSLPFLLLQVLRPSHYSLKVSFPSRNDYIFTFKKLKAKSFHRSKVKSSQQVSKRINVFQMVFTNHIYTKTLQDHQRQNSKLPSNDLIIDP